MHRFLPAKLLGLGLQTNAKQQLFGIATPAYPFTTPLFGKTAAQQVFVMN
jgi:hypothetical protein